ncbi:heterokaryon incompatibility protein-domain-containing protein [Podospora aff. communis PSN243]|uniref:Heterokaryon incompatibility protein-domain-containing protein n=1 Tax=Podospora aff. communis PSN243 TaxID=3040156 RepID=A0AAV9H053_9PEZI|nr:heterokaryon incompatibility protein-domain-containing protein [Podospora aff. communis PSN243]
MHEALGRQAKPTSPYAGEPLGDDETRVLHLAPGADDLPLTGSLQIVALDKEPVYEALSYEWGSPGKLQKFTTTDGCVIHITQSLHDALRDLRHRDLVAGRRVLWADGICINQDDVIERERQVSIMGRIYRQAQRVITYIGPEKDNGAAGVEMACKLWRLHHDPDGLDIDDLDAANLEEAGLASREDPSWAALKSLFLRSWASRCWCAQEFVCNENLIMMCGKTVLPSWEILPGVVQLCFSRQMPAALLPTPAEDTASLKECLWSLLRLRRALIPPSSAIEVDLWYLLTRFHPFQATDPRDKVYSLLGHDVDGSSPEIPVDYAVSVRDLYTKEAVLILNKRKDLKLLNSCLHQKNQSLPSWVPDWSTWHFGSGPGAGAHDRNILASGSTMSRFTIDEGMGGLEVAGCLVDEISWVGDGILPYYITHDGPAAARRKDWLERQLEAARNLDHSPDGTSDSSGMLWRSLIANTTHQETEAKDSYVRFFDAQRNVTNDSPEEQKEMARKFCDAVRWRSRYRSLASTKIGYFGAVPQTAQPGDIVCMFLGARHLFVVRPKGLDFTYVGHAYIHGLMRGEVLEAQWYRERTFALV